MARSITYVILISACGLLWAITRPGPSLTGLYSGLAVGLAVPLTDSLLENRRYLRLLWYAVRWRGRLVRVSASYLFRIKLGDKYLLVRGRRFAQYQPVGGVFKISPDARGLLNQIRALDDDLVPIDEVSQDDLRIRLPAMNLVRFVRWFESGMSRETSPWREFCEELVRPGLLPADLFPYIQHNFIRRMIGPIHYSARAQSLEIFIADIHELIPNAEQQAVLRELMASGNPDVVATTEDQIRRLGAVPGRAQEFRIAESAGWIL